jgi:hypothetical protein
MLCQAMSQKVITENKPGKAGEVRAVAKSDH